MACVLLLKEVVGVNGSAENKKLVNEVKKQGGRTGQDGASGFNDSVEKRGVKWVTSVFFEKL